LRCETEIKEETEESKYEKKRTKETERRAGEKMGKDGEM
jgi:hypothetical protein